MCICTHHKSFAATGGVVNPDFARRLEIERDELRSDLEFRRNLFQLQEQQLNDVRKERDEWKQKFIQQNKDLGCEMMDPGGTIWDYAKKLQADIAGWETKWKCAVEMAAVAENERDEVKRKHLAEHDLANEAIATWQKTRDERDALQEQLDAAIMLGKMQERRHERERDAAREQVKELAHENENLYRRLESVHEVYRLSSVCRKLLLENQQLKECRQSPTTDQ